MVPSDFFYFKTTHDLLLSVLYSELGLRSPTTLHTTYIGVALAFTDLRTALTSDLSEMVRCQTLDMDVSRATDMALFYDLYTNINYFSACGSDVEVLVHRGIFPSVAKMIATEDNVAQKVKEQCEAHASHHGDLVRHRMNKTLKSFNVNSYIHIG